MKTTPAKRRTPLGLIALLLVATSLLSTGCAHGRHSGAIIGTTIGAGIGYVIGSHVDHKHDRRHHRGHHDHDYRQARHDSRPTHYEPRPRRDPYCD